MHRSVVASFALSHFIERPNQPLLAGIASRINAKNLIDALNSGSRPVQHVAWKRLQDLPDALRESLVLKTLANDTTDNTESLSALLRALTHDSIPLTDDISSRIAVLMTSPQPLVQVAAAAVIALRQPKAAFPMLKQGVDLNRDVLRKLCLADDTDLIVPLMHAYGFPARLPPPTIGFMVTPFWLGDHHTQHPDLVEWLVRNCGYFDDSITRESLNLLSEGFSLMTSRMTNEPRVLKIAHLWQRRIQSFVWRLLPAELDLRPDDERPFDVTSPLDTALFLAAVRDSDRSVYLDQKSLPPFSHEAMKRELSPVCFHASSRYAQRLFIDQPLEWCDRWKIPEDQKGEFLIDHARVLLEPNDEARIAADRRFRGQWLSKSSMRSAAKSRKPVQSSTSPRKLVIGDFTPPLPSHSLSPGANSIVSLASACSLDHVAIQAWLQEAEQRWSSCLVPIGIELQIPQVDPDRFVAWKEALPFIGVPSPVRPEFGGMLEAAFRPARSFHSMVLGPLLLCRLTVIAECQDMALHLSLQGDFGDAIRSIAFPHLFIHPSQRMQNRPDGAMSRVMSKGFLHLHEDAERLSPSETNPRRTELRLFRVFAESESEHFNTGDDSTAVPNTTSGQSTSTSIKLNLGFVSDVIAVQVLASALASRCEACQQRFHEYAEAVRQAACALPEEFSQLLGANFFESTGDPRDECLLKHLPIFRCWSLVRQTVRSQKLSSDLDLQFRRLRNYHTRQILTHWADNHGLLSPEIEWADDEIELSLPEIL